MKSFVNIGFENYVEVDKIILILHPGTANVNKIVSKAKAERLFLTACRERDADSYVLTKDEFIFASALKPETIVRRIEENKKEKEINYEI